MEPNTTVQRGSDPALPATGARSIMIVDTDWKEGALVRNSLVGAGYDVSCWTEVADARDRLRVRNFEVVVFSTNLGDKGMDELLGDLRSRKVPPKVILVAGEDEGDAAARCFLRTVVVVNRPFKVSEVADIVEHLIGPAA
jgi:DNA-binding response OmpR family regulator